MADLFLKILNMSITAGYLVLAVVVLRLLLQKAPRWIFVLLWGIVAIRLLFPFSIESMLSLIPSAEMIPETVLSGPSFDVQPGIPPINYPVNDSLGNQDFVSVTTPTDNGPDTMTILSLVWLGGMLLMAAYTFISYWRLRRKVATAVRDQSNIFHSENVASPFVLGLVRPRIYLPRKIAQQDTAHVIAHEQAHIRRRDHWWKPLGFGLLTIHWFNPLMWLAYALLCRDIELACDEKVVRELGNDQRADYSETLLKCSIKRTWITGCPLAFGEVGVKERVKKVLNYKKTGFWIIVVAVIACIAVAVCFLTDPITDVLPEETQPSLNGPTAICWFDRLDDDYSLNGEMTLEEFPGVVFTWSFQMHNYFDSDDHLIMVDKDREISLFPNGSTRSVFVADITGDGLRDICANVYFFFSGLSSYNAVFVYDYANDCTYVLSGAQPQSHYKNISYYVRLDGSNLVCDKIHVSTSQVLASGTLALQDTGESKQLSLIPQVTYDSPVEYTFMRDNDWRDRVSLTVCADGTCDISFNPNINADGSADWAQGTYQKSDDKLIMHTEDGRTYTFRFVGDDLAFVAAESSPLPDDCALYNGAILIANPYFEAEKIG